MDTHFLFFRMTDTPQHFETAADLGNTLGHPLSIPDFKPVDLTTDQISRLRDLAQNPDADAKIAEYLHSVTAVTTDARRGVTQAQIASDPQLGGLAAQAAQVAAQVRDAATGGDIGATARVAVTGAAVAARATVADIQSTPGVAGKIDKAVTAIDNAEDGWDGMMKKLQDSLKKTNPGIYKLLVWLDIFDDDTPSEPVAIVANPTPPDPNDIATKKANFDRTEATLIGLSGHPQEIKDVLESTKGQKFSDLKKAYEGGESGISERLGLKLPDHTMYVGIGAIVKHEKLIDDFLSKSNPTWRDGTLEDVLGSIHGQIGILDGITRTMKDLRHDVETGNFKGLLSFLPKIGSELSLTPSPDGTTSQGALSQRLADLRMEHPLFRNITPRLLANIKTHGQNIPVGRDDAVEYLGRFEIDKPLTVEEQTFINTLVTFGRGMQEVLIKQCSFDQEDKYREFFIKHPLTLSQAFDFFVIAGGEASYANLNKTEKSMIMFKLFSITLEEDSDFNAEHTLNPMLSELGKAVSGEASKIEIPDSVAEYINIGIKTLAEGALDLGDRVLSFIRKAAPTSALITFGAAFLGFIYLSVNKYTSVAMKVVSVAPTALLIASIAGIVDVVMQGKSSIDIGDGGMMTRQAMIDHATTVLTDPANIQRVIQNGGLSTPQAAGTPPTPPVAQ